MARQPKTAKPKSKFLRACLRCKEIPTRLVVDGKLVVTCGCDD